MFSKYRQGPDRALMRGKGKVDRDQKHTFKTAVTLKENIIQNIKQQNHL